MFKFQGLVLNKKRQQSKKGDEFAVVTLLDQNERFSVVRDVVDFNDYFTPVKVNSYVEFPCNVRVNVSEKTGRGYLNIVAQGRPVMVDAVTTESNYQDQEPPF